MIRSTNVSLKYANKCKTDKISWFVSEYVKVVDSFIDILWSIEKVPQLLPKKYTSQIKTPLMSWAIQCAGKQASGIVRGTRKKLEQRQYIVNKLINEGNIKKARKLQRIIDESSVSKPTLDHINPELDSRFVTIDLENSTSFDGWLSLQGILPKEKIKIPFKKNKHFNKLLESGKIKYGIRLSKTKITFMFDLPDVDKKEHGETIGIDIGQTTVISCSNGHLSTQNNHGYDLAKISDILARKKKDSKAFLKAQKHRTNYINWAINQINLDSINVVKLENIKNIRKNKKFSRRLSHWTYTEIFSKLESKCEEMVSRFNAFHRLIQAKDAAIVVGPVLPIGKESCLSVVNVVSLLTRT